MNYRCHALMISLGFVVMLPAGCSREATPIALPAVSAADAGAAAVAAYDENENGVIDTEELLLAPALRAAQPRLDTNTDGQITAGEIVARIETWQATGLGLLTVPVEVTLDGQPLEGATVTLKPARFLGDAFKPAIGITKPSGRTTVSLAEADLANAGTTGVPPGFYTVHISKFVDGKESLPPRYNAQTTLGVEVALDTEYANSGFTFDLESFQP